MATTTSIKYWRQVKSVMRKPFGLFVFLVFLLETGPLAGVPVEAAPAWLSAVTEQQLQGQTPEAIAEGWEILRGNPQSVEEIFAALADPTVALKVKQTLAAALAGSPAQTYLEPLTTALANAGIKPSPPR